MAGVPRAPGVASLFKMLDGVLKVLCTGDGDVTIGVGLVADVGAEGDATKIPLSTCSSASFATSGSVQGTIPIIVDPPPIILHCLYRATWACTGVAYIM